MTQETLPSGDRDEDGRSAEADGLSSDDGAASVSALRASIPSAWEPIEYDDGYPEDEEFAAFDGAPFDLYAAAHWLLEELPRACDHMPCSCDVREGVDSFWEKPVNLIEFSTGGWSGAESIIRLIERRHDMAHFMESWRRGGHFVFEIPQHFLAHRGLAQAMSASPPARSALPMRPNNPTLSTNKD